jgi:hypothetical protein
VGASLAELISTDARLNVLDRYAGKFADAPYFFNYDRWPWAWKLALGEVDGEPVLIVLQRGADAWTSYSVVRMKVIGQEVEQILEYIHCPWMIPAATSISLIDRRIRGKVIMIWLKVFDDADELESPIFRPPINITSSESPQLQHA